MPVLDVEVVTRPAERLRDGLAAEIAERAGEIFASAPGGAWVKVRALAREQYAENAGGPPEGVYPVFVSVLKSRQPPPEQMREEVARLTTAIAEVCDRPAENVHILYLPDGAGRVAFGGNLVLA